MWPLGVGDHLQLRRAGPAIRRGSPEPGRPRSRHRLSRRPSRGAERGRANSLAACPRRDSVLSNEVRAPVESSEQGGTRMRAHGRTQTGIERVALAPGLCNSFEARKTGIPRTSRSVCQPGNGSSRADPARGSRKLPPAPANARNGSGGKPRSRWESPTTPAHSGSAKTVWGAQIRSRCKPGRSQQRRVCAPHRPARRGGTQRFGHRVLARPRFPGLGCGRDSNPGRFRARNR